MWPPPRPGPSDGPPSCLFEIDNNKTVRDRRPTHRRRCRVYSQPHSSNSGRGEARGFASVRSFLRMLGGRGQGTDTMAETGSTRVPRRINTLFASNLDQLSNKGGRRVPHFQPLSPHPPLLLTNDSSHSRARCTVRSIQYGYAGPGRERYCAGLALTGQLRYLFKKTNTPPPPNPPLSAPNISTNSLLPPPSATPHTAAISGRLQARGLA